MSIGWYCTARVCCYIFSLVPKGVLSGAKSRDTQKGHTCSWTDLLSKWRSLNASNLVPKQINEGVRCTPNMYTFTYIDTDTCRSDKEWNTVTPWNKCKVPYTWFSIISWGVKSKQTSQLDLQWLLGCKTWVWTTHPRVCVNTLRIAQLSDWASNWHPGHMTMPWLPEKFHLVLPLLAIQLI